MTGKPLILFFVPVPTREKGATGAVIGSQTVIEAAQSAYDCLTVPVRHSIIRDADAGLSPASVMRLISDHRASLAGLKTAVSKAQGRPLTLYMVANSGLAASLRDFWTMRAVLGLRPDAKICLHTRNGNYFYPRNALLRRLRSWMLARANTVICLSQLLVPEREELDALAAGTADKLRVIPNTIDTAMVPVPRELAAKHKRAPEDDAPINVLYLSNFIATKGYGLVGEAARILHQRGVLHRFRFTFRGKWLGDGDKAAFKAEFDPALFATDALDIGDAVWDRGDVRALLLKSDVFCLPTRYPAEAMPRSIIEAMANGCAIIANSHAAIPDLVTDGENGLLRAGITASEIADFLEGLTRETLQDYQSAALSRFAENFSRASHDAAVLEALA